MSSADFKDATLILVGHGSTLNADSSTPTHLHADSIRAQGIFGQVLTCFWKEEPAICAVLRQALCKRVFIVPLFISEGYFTEQVIPRELGLVDEGRVSFPLIVEKGEQQVHYCGPVGTHDSMTRVILSRAEDVLKQHPFPRLPKKEDTTLFVAGHGTGNNEQSRKIVEHQARILAETSGFAAAHAIFMEEEPKIESVYTLSETRNVVLVPFFISDGLHSYEDIPMMLGEPEKRVQERMRQGQPTWRNPTERKGKQVWYSRSIGDEPGMVDVILERVNEAAMPTVAN